MNVETLLGHMDPNNEEEVRAVLGILQRANDAPAVVVTLPNGGGKGRRYVVSREDESMFDGINTPADFEETYGWRGWFGGQWLRSYGRVDEMYRSLSGPVLKIERIDRRKVWGER
jgi:hypothetical protein